MATDAEIAAAARRYVLMSERYEQLTDDRPGDEDNEIVYDEVLELERELRRLVLEAV